MSVKERLKKYIKSKGLTIRSFEDSINASNGYVNSISKGIGTEYLEKIREIYPDLDLKWLLFSDKLDEIDSNTQTNDITKNHKVGVPYYENIEVTGGILPMYSDNKEIPTFFINYEHFNDCTAYLPVVGDSMYPNYCSGEIIAVKEIHNFDVILWGETYFITTNSNANDLKTIKQLHYHEDDTKLVLRSSNPNYKGDIVINKEDVLHLFIVKGKIKRNQL